MAPEYVTGEIAGMKTATLVMLLLIGSSFAHAQNAPDGRWHYLVEPYAMFPNMRGETGIGNLPPISVDEDPSDIFDKLQMGAMLYVEARNDTWTFSSDVLFMDLGADFGDDDPVTLLEGELDVSQVGWELAAMRRLTPWLELGLAATYNQVDVDLEVNVALPGPPTQITAGREEDWIDPTIVMRATLPINDHWFFQARGNVGGFGVGSELMWQIMADVGYRPSQKWFFTFGYRIIDIDYDSGGGPDRFVYDMQTFGPVARIGFEF
jgi:hypothetical protein